MSFEETVIVTILFIAAVMVAGVIIHLQEKKYQSLNESYTKLLDHWQTYLNKTNQEKQSLWTEIEELEKENKELKEQNVSRETTYNKSYGTPEVINWVEQNYAGEDINRG